MVKGLSVYVTEEVHGALKKAAGRAGLTLKDYVCKVLATEVSSDIAKSKK